MVVSGPGHPGPARTLLVFNTSIDIMFGNDSTARTLVQVQNPGNLTRFFTILTQLYNGQLRASIELFPASHWGQNEISRSQIHARTTPEALCLQDFKFPACIA